MNCACACAMPIQYIYLIVIGTMTTVHDRMLIFDIAH